MSGHSKWANIKHKKGKTDALKAKMATKIGREITVAARMGGADPTGNMRLKLALQKARENNIPKDNIQRAIDKGVGSSDMNNYEEITYEGYAPFGIAILVETATDNPTRTVANIRMHFNREEGSLGTSGSVAFMFDRKGLFKFSAEGKDLESLELELIDFGLQEIWEEDGNVYLYSGYEDFGGMTKALEDRGIEIVSSELTRVPLNTVEITEEQEQKVMALIDRLEDDEDVQSVYHNMK